MTSAIKHDRIVVVLSADDRYSRPMAVTARSLVATMSPGRSMDLHLCDMGISAANKSRIEEAAAHPNVTIHWITSLDAQVAHLPLTWDHITLATYARLLIPKVLTDEPRSLYLDVDLIARRCVGDLFDMDLAGNLALGVPDATSPFVSSPYGIPFWASRGIPPETMNVNCGVLLTDLDAWREEDIGGAAMEYAGRHRTQFFGGDQEAINAVLPGRIGVIDPRWNQQTRHYDEIYNSTLPYEPDVLKGLLDDPWIVHFSTWLKAWTYGSGHPFRDEWFTRLDETPFRGWRPRASRYYGSKVAASFGRVVNLVGSVGHKTVIIP